MPKRTSLSFIKLLVLEENPLVKIQELIKQDPDLLNAIDDSGYTLLLTAVSVENFKVASWLVNQAGIDIDCTNAAGVTPLHLAIKRNNLYITRSLLEKGAKLLPDKSARTPFHEVTNSDIANLLYRYHRDFNTVDIDGHFPFYYALGRDIELIEFFSQNGAYLVQEQEQDWLNLLEEHQDDEAIQQLIFLAACRQSNKEIVESLIKHHPNLINSRNSVGNTPYLYAAMSGQKSLAKWLLGKGHATTDEKNELGRTAFLLAAAYGQIPFAQWLLKKEYAKSDETDNYNFTAFMLTVENNQIPFAKWWLEKNYANVTEEHLPVIRYFETGRNSPALEFIVILIEHYFQHSNFDALTVLINFIDATFSKNRSASLIPAFIEQINTRCAENNFSFALQIAKIALKLKPNKFAKQALEIIELAIQKIFAEAPKEFDKEEQLEPIKSLIEEFISFDIANPRILLYAANFYQRLGLWKHAYNTFETILELPKTPDSDVTEESASLEIADLILNGYIAVGNESGIDMDDSTEIQPKDDEDTQAQKIKLKESLLITRAIQAYEYVVPFENTEAGGRLLPRVHNMLMGIDNVEEAPWSADAISHAMARIDAVDSKVKNLLSRVFWDKVFATHKNILDDSNSSQESKQAASLSIAELFMNSRIGLTQGMDVTFQPEDDEVTRIDKKQRTITRAIQAYEYVVLYKHTDGGNLLLGDLHKIFSRSEDGKNWVPKVIEQFGQYYGIEAKFSEYVWQKARAERVTNPEENLQNYAAETKSNFGLREN